MEYDIERYGGPDERGTIKACQNVVDGIAIEILKENLRKGKSIEIPSLNLSINPDGSVNSLDKKLSNF